MPENDGWVWSSETIGEANPRYIHVKLGAASGVVDLSRVAAGKLLYDSRQISVTFARFNHAIDYWRADIQTFTNRVIQAFAGGAKVTIVTKTNPNMAYMAYAVRWSVSRDGIIQYITFTFDVDPANTYYYSRGANAGHQEVDFYKEEADDATLKIVCRDIVCYDSDNNIVNATISIYDDNGTLVGAKNAAGWEGDPLIVDMANDSVLEYTVSVTGVPGWSVLLAWTKEEL